MAQIPKSILELRPLLFGLPLIGRGKVRDSYGLPGCPDKMLVVASNCCSIFDFVLPTMIDQKGEVLTALNYLWTKEALNSICQTDLVACGEGIDKYLPNHLCNNADLQKRATVVQIKPPPDSEDIVRIILTGSGLKDYKATGTVGGHKLPAGLIDGSLLPFPIYTPSTKEESGHDVNITADSVIARHGFKRERLALQVAGAIASYAAERGIMLADTKFEFSGEVLIDEKGTPDSSRFVDRTAWEKAREKRKFPASLDKQYVREWGKLWGIDKRDPKNPDDVAFVHAQVVPDNVRRMTTLIYRYIFWRLAGTQIEIFQHSVMGICVPARKRKIEIIVGSASDLPQIEMGMESLPTDTRVSVISCHRNPEELRQFAKDELINADVVIAAAGKAADLPGIIKSWLCHFGRPDIPVIGVGLKGQTRQDDLDAMSSIEGLPGQPVELDYKGQAYFGREGFVEACSSARWHEFLPKGIEAKPVQIGIKKFS